jgi:predicted nucleotidyltransferase
VTAETLHERLGVDRAALAAFCRKWHVAEMALFGSVLRDDFGDGSDVDALVTFEPGTVPHFPDILDMREEFRDLVGREVDLVKRAVIERSRNYVRREDILSTAQVIYAA